jgi:hypothetical protein
MKNGLVESLALRNASDFIKETIDKTIVKGDWPR